MSKFGWSYPAGCSGTPFDAPDPPCDVCAKPVDDCICPECPVCGTIGEQSCYEQHGMTYSEAQQESLRFEQAKWEADNSDSYYEVLK